MSKFTIRIAGILLFVYLIFIAFTAKAANTPDMEVGIIEHLDEYIPSDIILTDHTGKTVNLKQLINKPTVLCFVYYRCPGICSPLMNGLAESIAKSGLALNKEYQVLTISFDSREHYDLGAKKRTTYLEKIKGQDGDGWIFLTGDSSNIEKATKALGFRYKFVNNEFMHEGALMMISPEGKITRYLKGISFLPLEYKLAVYEAAKGKSAPTLIKVLQFCYSYDRKAERYSLEVTRIAATITIFFAVVLLLFLLIKGRRNKINKQTNNQ